MLSKAETTQALSVILIWHRNSCVTEHVSKAETTTALSVSLIWHRNSCITGHVCHFYVSQKQLCYRARCLKPKITKLSMSVVSRTETAVLQSTLFKAETTASLSVILIRRRNNCYRARCLKPKLLKLSLSVVSRTETAVVTAVACQRSRSFCQKCRWQVTTKHACTLRMWLCMK